MALDQVLQLRMVTTVVTSAHAAKAVALAAVVSASSVAASAVVLVAKL